SRRKFSSEGSVGVTGLGGRFWQKYLEVLPKSSKTSGSILRRNSGGVGSSASDVSDLCSGRFRRSTLLMGFQRVPIRSLKAPLDASRALWELARGYAQKRFCPRFYQRLSYFW